MSSPLATLACTISPTGISAPNFNAIQQSLIATFQSIYGSDVLLNPNDQDMQLISIFAQAQSDSNQATIAVYTSFQPTFAQGVNLSNLVKINGIQRQIASFSTATLTISGNSGTQIINGVAQDANNNLWNLPALVVIPFSGSINVTATCQTPGAVAAGSGTITTIFTATLGWQTVTNASAAVIGAPVEVDGALRQRQAISVSLPALTPLQSITAAIANVSGVQNLKVYENDTGITDGNGIPPHSISAVVLGGSISAIATAIERSKNPGTGTFGSTSVVVTDPLGLPITINFYQLATQSIFVSLTITQLAGYVGSTATAITAAIVAFINSLAIGQSVRYSWVEAAAQMISNPLLGETYEITALTIGTSASPVGTTDIIIPFNEQAVCVTGNVVLTGG